jgi:hypothetical protein
MVDIAYNQAGLHSFTIGRRHCHQNRESTEMEKKVHQGCQERSRSTRLSSRAGLEVTQLFSTFGRGTSIFLDIPLYRTRR